MDKRCTLSPVYWLGHSPQVTVTSGRLGSMARERPRVARIGVLWHACAAALKWISVVGFVKDPTGWRAEGKDLVYMGKIGSRPVSSLALIET
jgi:hypothetical protein